MDKLTLEEVQYLINAIDTEVKQQGLQNAGKAWVIATKLQEYAKTIAQPKVEQSKEPAKES